MISSKVNIGASPPSSPFAVRIVVVNFLLMALVFNGIFTVPGLFLPALEAYFGISRAQAGFTMTLTMLSGILGNWAAGKYLMRYNVRSVVSILLLVNGLTFFGNAAAPSIGLIYAMSLIRGFFAPFLHIIPVSIQINRWFEKGHRGRALSLSMIGSGVAAIFLNPLTGLFIERYGWRSGYLFWGALSVLMIIPVRIGYGSPKSQNSVPDSGQAGVGAMSGFTVKQALALPSFRLAALAVFGIAGCTQNWNYSGGTFLFDMGYDQVALASIMSITSIGTLISKLFLGDICDRFGVKKAAVFVVLCLAAGYIAGIGALLFGRFMVIPSAFLIGIGFTSITIILPLYVEELFGEREYGALLGNIQVCMNMGNTILPFAGALLYEAAGNYMPSWISFCILCVVVLLGILFSYRALPSERMRELERK